MVGWSGPAEVIAGAGVDLDPLAALDEQGDLYNQARLQGGRLAGTRHPVALHPGLGLGDYQFHGSRELHPDHLLAEQQD